MRESFKVGASVAVAATTVGAFGWMLNSIDGRLGRIETELTGIHQDVARIDANQRHLLQRFPPLGGRPAEFSGADRGAIAADADPGTGGTPVRFFVNNVSPGSPPCER